MDRNSLNFSEHVSTMGNKMTRSISPIYKVGNTFPSDILNRLYRTIVLPHFLNAIEAYYGTTKFNISKLEVLQRRAVRAIDHGVKLILSNIFCLVNFLL